MNWKQNILKVFAGAALLCVASHANGQSLRLRPTATLEAGTIHVGDVATIEGLDPTTAEMLSQTPVATASKATTIRAEQVLFAILTENGRTSVTTQLQVNGPTECAVQIAGSDAAQPMTAHDTGANRPAVTAVGFVSAPAAVTVPTMAASESPAAPVRANAEKTTLSELLVSQVVEQLGVKQNDVRINFDTISPLLDQPVTGDQRWVIRQNGHTLIGTVQWNAQLLQGSRLLQRLLVQASITQRSTVLIAHDNLRNGDIITAAQVTTEERWLDRKIPTLFSKPEEVIGQVVLPQLGIAGGTALDQRDFKPVSMAVKGDLVTVYMISGSLTIKNQAKAMSSGRLHEAIQLRADDTSAKSDADFQGVLIGRDVAVVGGPIDPATEAKLKEQR
jgi:flagella basal body P-ring formation protein FlgA